MNVTEAMAIYEVLRLHFPHLQGDEDEEVNGGDVVEALGFLWEDTIATLREWNANNPGVL